MQPNWYQQSIQQEAGTKDILATLMLFLSTMTMEQAVAATAQKLKVSPQEVATVAQQSPQSKKVTMSFPQFIQVLHKVECGGCPNGGVGARGDYNPKTKQYEALGPLQIHYDYWLDSGAGGRYEDCANLDFSAKVVEGYMRRYAPKALAAGDAETLARTHNGGPGRSGTDAYWAKFLRAMGQSPPKP